MQRVFLLPAGALTAVALARPGVAVNEEAQTLTVKRMAGRESAGLTVAEEFPTKLDRPGVESQLGEPAALRSAAAA